MESEPESFYARMYAFGMKQAYDEDHLIVLKDKMIFGFTGKNNQKVEKKMRFTSDAGTKRTFRLSGIISRAQTLMRKEYPNYQGQDLVEGVEITQENDHTYIWIYRPFNLTTDRIFIPGSTKTRDESAA